jgi:hypothetical protein
MEYVSSSLIPARGVTSSMTYHRQGVVRGLLSLRRSKHPYITENGRAASSVDDANTTCGSSRHARSDSGHLAASVQDTFIHSQFLTEFEYLAGQTVFYNSNILHCGAYNSKQRRATLHGCMGDTRGGSTRARNVLQHGLLWMTEDRFRDQLSGRGRKMLQALIDMKKGVKGDVGYSQMN